MSSSDAVARVRTVMELVAAALECEGSVDVRLADGQIVGEFRVDEPASLIGHHGVMIDAVQDLAGKIAFHGERSRMPVVVDAGGYRERRRVALCAVADRAAGAALREHEPVELDPMGAHERKIVHEYLKSRAGIETYSEGREPARYLVVAPIVE